jgi:hypothetical protein
MTPKQVSSRAIFLLLLYFAWLAMMAVHEFGHVLAAYLTGATVTHVSLPLLGFSRTDVVHNTHPAIVAWGGPVGGCLLPLLAWLIARPISPTLAKLAQFFAGFCLIINGLYVGIGWTNAAGDAGDLLRHGMPVVALIGFGAVATCAGLYLWHRLGQTGATQH